MQKIRVGIVGCGEVTQIMHLHSLYQLADRFEVTALCDASATVVETVGEDWNIAKRFTDERDLIDQDDVDAVLVASPNHYHAQTTIRACDAGKHVLVEKPMCMNLREADEVIAARNRADVTVQVAYMRRYAPAFVEACQIVRDMSDIRLARVHDVIGQNALIIAKTSRVVRGKDIPAAVMDAGKAREAALFAEAIGDAPAGLRLAYGILLGLASHDISAMRELLGMPNGVLYAAYRHGGLYITSAMDYGDFVCHVEIGVDSIPRYDTFLQVYGSHRIVRVQYNAPYVRNLPTPLRITEVGEGGRIGESEVNPSWGDNFTLEWEAFYDNVTQKKTPKTSPEDFQQDLELFRDMVALMR